MEITKEIVHFVTRETMLILGEKANVEVVKKVAREALRRLEEMDL